MAVEEQQRAWLAPGWGVQRDLAGEGQLQGGQQGDLLAAEPGCQREGEARGEGEAARGQPRGARGDGGEREEDEAREGEAVGEGLGGGGAAEEEEGEPLPGPDELELVQEDRAGDGAGVLFELVLDEGAAAGLVGEEADLAVEVDGRGR